MKTLNLNRLFFTVLTLISTSLLWAGTPGYVTPTGGVSDPTPPIPVNTYVTISTYYNGGYYYLGVDTAQALVSNTYALTVYNQPNHATMWKIGRFYSPTGSLDYREGKGFQRELMNAWIYDKRKKQDGTTPVEMYLTLSSNKNNLELGDENNHVMWYFDKETIETGKYMNGQIYFYSNENSLDVYRYIEYDPLYGYDHCMSTKPTTTKLHMTVWTRKTGPEGHAIFDVPSITFPYSTEAQTVTLNVGLSYTANADYFTNNYGSKMLIYVRKGTTVTGQAAADLVNTAGGLGQYSIEFDSSIDSPRDKRNPDYEMGQDESLCDENHGASGELREAVATYYDMAGAHPDATMMTITYTRTTDTEEHCNALQWNGDHSKFILNINTPSGSPINYYTNAGKTQLMGDIEEYLHFKATVGAVTFHDSLLVVRKVYHTLSQTPITMDYYYKDGGGNKYPNDYTFTNTTTPGTQTYYIDIMYRNGFYLMDQDNQVVRTETGQEIKLDLDNEEDYIDHLYDQYNPETDISCETIDDETVCDTTWSYLPENDIHCGVILYEVQNMDGTACTWLHAAPGTHKNELVLTADARDESNRYAKILLSYNYRHSASRSDIHHASRYILITQLGVTATLPITWDNPQNNSPFGETHEAEKQFVHEQHRTLYAIPGETGFALPLSRHYYGWYRWYDFESNHDIHLQTSNKIFYTEVPKVYAGGAGFIPINNTESQNQGSYQINFDVNKTPTTPSIEIPAAFSNTAEDRRIACDVSAYQDYTITSTDETHGSVTEATLSYREIFELESGVKIANKMADAMDFSDEDDYVEERDILAPLNQSITIKPESRYATTQHCEESEMGYIYYFDDSGDDPVIGTKISPAPTTADKYNRVGLTREEATIPSTVELISKSDIDALPVGGEMDVVMISPMKTYGYALGVGNAYTTVTSNYTISYTGKDIKNNSDALALANQVKDQQANILTLKKTSNGIRIYNRYRDAYLTPNYYGSTEYVDWVTLSSTQSEIQYYTFDFTSYDIPNIDSRRYNTNYFEESNTNLVRLYTSYCKSKSYGMCTSNKTGYLAANSTTTSKEDGWLIFGKKYYEKLASNSPNAVSLTTGPSCDYPLQINYGWYFYKINRAIPGYVHKETAYWQVSDNGTSWTNVSPSDVDEYGNLKVLVNSATPADITPKVKYYRLRTEHFKLFKTKVTFVNPEQAKAATGTMAMGPSATAIITEDDIEQGYDVAFDLGEAMRTNTTLFPNAHKPTNNEPQFLFAHLYPWSYTEYAYHYPTTVESLSGKRVYTTDALENGEYCITNIYSGKDGQGNDQTIESYDGAANGWMIHYKVANEPLVCMDFTYSKAEFGCASQETYFTAYLNALGNNLCLRAFIYGVRADNGKEVLLNEFNSGIIRNNNWQMISLPVTSYLNNKPTSPYKDYDRLHIKAYTSAAPGTDFFLDKIRILNKKRPVVVSQTRATTCLGENESNEIILNMRYCFSEANSAMAPGTYACYQIARKSEGDANFTVLDGATSPADTRTDIVKPCYLVTGTAIMDNGRFKDRSNHDYGLIPIPERNYDPSLSATTDKQSNIIKTYLQLLDANLDPSEPEFGESRYAHNINESGAVISEISEIANGTATNNGHTVVRAYYKDDAGNWWIYIMAKVKAQEGDEFRIEMTTTDDPFNEQPIFGTTACGRTSYISIKKALTLQLDGADYTDPTTERPGNKTYTFTLKVEQTVDETACTGLAAFDFVRGFDWCKDYLNMTGVTKDTADARFLRYYGYSYQDIFNALDIFRANVEENTAKNIMKWENVSYTMFMYDERPQEEAQRIYNILNHLVEIKFLQVGLPMAPFNVPAGTDAYAWMRPIASSGYVMHNSDKVPVVVCDKPIWGEIHTAESQYQLRFGTKYAHEHDPLNLPVVHATAHQANEVGIQMRVDAISRHKMKNPEYESDPTKPDSVWDPMYCIILGWDSTKVISTNDPAWSKMIAAYNEAQAHGTAEEKLQHPYPSFRYSQDRILQATDIEGYYQVGENVVFTPVNAAHITELNCTTCDPLNGSNGKNKWHVTPNPSGNPATPGYQVANTFQLHAGYWYQFETTMMNFNLSPYINGEQGEVATTERDDPHNANYKERMGKAYFILLVAPDTAVWTPQNKQTANYWDDPMNWTMIVDGKSMTERIRTPMEDTKVIIPTQTETDMYPFVRAESTNNKDANYPANRDCGYQHNTCSDILFKPSAMIKGQELLTYKRAFVDTKLTVNQWTSFAAPIKDVCSGDLYIPHDYEVSDTSSFTPGLFDDNDLLEAGKRHTHKRSIPFGFDASFFNSAVNTMFYNTDIEEISTTEITQAGWQPTNALSQLITPGIGVTLAAYSTDPIPANRVDNVILRLPKQETEYYFYNSSGDRRGSETVRTTAFNNVTNNLSYNKTALGANEGINYTITNGEGVVGTEFVFGNPTMGMIDLYQFCQDNSTKLAYETVNAKNVYTIYTLDNSTWTTKQVWTKEKAFNGKGQYYLQPGKAVMLKSNEAKSSLTLTLKPGAITLLTAEEELQAASAPTRYMDTEEEEALLGITALVDVVGRDRYVSYLQLKERASANNGYIAGEDAKSMSSGVNDPALFDDCAAFTPISMYSVATNEALSIDTRNNVENVPLAFTLLDNVMTYGEDITLFFSMEGHWNHPLYFHDAFTGDSIRIFNGMMMNVTTPESGQRRYYINYRPNSTPLTPTSIDPMDGGQKQKETTTQEQDVTTIIYDVLGREMMRLSPDQLLKDVHLPQGVYLIQRGTNVERRVIR